MNREVEDVRILRPDYQPGRCTKSVAARALCRPSLQNVFEKIGIHLTPVHFYQPLPEFLKLPEYIWSEVDSVAGVEFDAEDMKQLLYRMSDGFRDEYRRFPGGSLDSDFNGFYLNNGYFESVDAELLYGLVRLRKPVRIIEIGSGFSTRLMRLAIERNRNEDHSYQGRMTTVDPFASESLELDTPSWAKILRAPIQAIDPRSVESLEEGDMLFIDSSHVVATNSDVVFEFLQLIPRVRPGVLVHVHDIFIPCEYPRRWLRDGRMAWNEQYLLQAFLSFSEAFRVVFAAHWAHINIPDSLAEAVPSYDRTATEPGSFYFERYR